MRWSDKHGGGGTTYKNTLTYSTDVAAEAQLHKQP